MPKFILDTAGAVQTPEIRWADLDAFTQGYIEAAFFTEQGDGNPDAEDGTKSGLWVEVEPGLWSSDLGFSDLAPDTLATMIADCTKFQDKPHAGAPLGAALELIASGIEEATTRDMADAGRDFWFTRNGHGCGFWDGDWPEPYATALADAARAFGQVDLYVGDDGKVYL